MKILLNFMIIILLSGNVYSQVTSNDVNVPDYLNPDFNVDTFQFRYNLSLMIGQFESRSSESSLIEVPVLFTYPISERLNLLFGTKFDFYKIKGSLINEVGISGSLGLQYDFNKDAFIQGLFNYQLNDANASQIYYNSGSRTSFKLRTGFKF